MYAKDYTSETPAIDNAILYIRRAFDAGMMPSQLTNDELVFLRTVYGAEWYREFGFESETYSGLEKKTTRHIRPNPIAMPSVPRGYQLRSSVESVEDAEEEEEDEEDAEINRQSSYVYTVWS